MYTYNYCQLIISLHSFICCYLKFMFLFFTSFLMYLITVPGHLLLSQPVLDNSSFLRGVLNYCRCLGQGTSTERLLQVLRPRQINRETTADVEIRAQKQKLLQVLRSGHIKRQLAHKQNRLDYTFLDTVYVAFFKTTPHPPSLSISNQFQFHAVDFVIKYLKHLRKSRINIRIIKL